MIKQFCAAALATSALALAVSPSIAKPTPFVYRLLPVDKCVLSIDTTDYDIPILPLHCKGPIAAVQGCGAEGGQVGTIGSRLVCRIPTERAAANQASAAKTARRPLLPRPTLPEAPVEIDAVSAQTFVPILVPKELYNGQSDPRALKQ